MQKMILIGVMIAFFGAAMPALAQDKPVKSNKAETTVKPQNDQAKQSDAAKQKARDDLKAFFDEGIEQARDLPAGCGPMVEPKTSKPVA